MTLNACIDAGVKEGVITDDQATVARTLFTELEAEYRATQSPEAAAAAAARDTFDKLKADAAHSKRLKLLQIKRFQALQKALGVFRCLEARQGTSGARVGGCSCDIHRSRQACQWNFP